MRALFKAIVKRKKTESTLDTVTTIITMAQMKFALMLWPTDDNLVSVHSLDYIRKPKKAFNDFQVGDDCLTFYPKHEGPDGVSDSGEMLWKSIILAVGGKKQFFTSYFMCMQFRLA